MEESEQWKLAGNCEKCRRKNYCKTVCTKRKRRAQKLVQSLATEVMDTATCGAYSKSMEMLGRQW